MFSTARRLSSPQRGAWPMASHLHEVVLQVVKMCERPDGLYPKVNLENYVERPELVRGRVHSPRFHCCCWLPGWRPASECSSCSSSAGSGTRSWSVSQWGWGSSPVPIWNGNYIDYTLWSRSRSEKLFAIKSFRIVWLSSSVLLMHCYYYCQP